MSIRKQLSSAPGVPALLALGVLISCVALDCNAECDAVCGDSARFAVTLPAPAAASDLTITLCRNGNCSVPCNCADLRSPMSDVGGNCNTDDSGQVSQIQIQWGCSGCHTSDGDVFEIRVTVPSSTEPLIDWKAPVNFQMGHDEICGSSCKHATVNLP